MAPPGLEASLSVAAESASADASGLLQTEGLRRTRPPRVLHIVESLDRGAVETWLVRMLRHAHLRGAKLDWTFYCALGRSGAMDEEACSLGARVMHSPEPIGRKVAFAAALRRVVREGDYDVVHCHHDLVSGLYLLAIAGLRVPRRIVHAHNADEGLPTPSVWKRVLLREPLRLACLTLADRRVGISQHTLDTLLGGRKRRADDVVHYYGVDPAPFAAAPDGAALRRELGLSTDAKILLFAGRVVPEKNPLVAVDVLAAMRRRDPRVVAVFAGAGSQEADVRRRAAQLGLEDAIHLLGWRSDVPAVMKSSDWFILPRPEKPREGFGLAVVEAQLAGLRMLLSLGIPDDPLLRTAIYRRLSLAAGPEAWAEAAFEMTAVPSNSSDAISALGSSPLDMDRALADLIKLHV